MATRSASPSPAAEGVRLAPIADVGELAERVGKLEAELASMRKMLKRLKAEVAGKDDEAA